jgi:outer membrane protein assembly factor BamB
MKRLVCALLISVPAAVFAAGEHDRPSPAVSLFATGFDNPRGLAFGPDGRLYVAAAGTGGVESTAAICPELQIGPPFGPYVNGPTARISRVDRHGHRTTVVDGLPSGQSQFPDWQGVADVAFIGKTLFGLVQGGGCSYGVADAPKSVMAVNLKTGRSRILADLGAFRRAHPTPIPDDDLEPEGVFFNMVSLDGRLYVVDVNTGGLLEVRRNGRIRTVVDFTARFGHIAPAALAVRDGVVYVGNIHELPIVDGASVVYAVNPRTGHLRKVASGLTVVVAIQFDKHGRLYALEMGNGQGSGFPDPGAGRVVRVGKHGDLDVIVDGLTFPTGMTFGPDGRLYVSNRGFDIPPNGTGEILAVDVR